MWKNYLKIAWRNLLRNRIDSLINIGGLTIGFIAVFLILIYVSYSKSFDGDLKDSKNIYRVNLSSSTEGEKLNKSARTSPAMGMVFKEDIGDVEDFSRVIILGEVIAGQNDSFIREDQIFISDENYLNLFDVSLKSGKKEEINEPLKVFLSESIANKIFGDENPIGKSLDINSTNFDGTVQFQVGGVYENLPSNRHLRPEILISYATLHHFLGKEIDMSFDWLNQYTFLKIKDGVNPDDLIALLNESLQTHYGDRLKATNTSWEVDLISVGNIHNSMDYSGEPSLGVDGKKLSYFLWIGLFVLLMVYLNSINIATSKAQNRSKEIGVRKVSGSSRAQLVRLFLVESFVSHFLATVFTCLVIFPFGPLINSALDLGLPESSFSFQSLLPWILGFWVLGSVLSGIYPAIFLTSFSPAKSLKGEVNPSIKQAFSSPLLVMQLVFCLIIIAGILTTYRQIDFMRSQDLGLNLQDKIVVHTPMLYVDGSGNYQEKMKASLGSLSGVKSITAANEIPGNEIYWKTDDFHLLGKEKNGSMYSMLNVGLEYFELLEMNFLAGRTFNPGVEGEEAIINELAMANLGISRPEEAIGKTLVSGNGEATIVGVIENYNQEALNTPKSPIVLNFSPGDLKYYILKTENSHPKELIEKLEESFNENFPQSPFEYFFLDQFFDRQYKSELQFQRLFGVASLIAVLIAVMGIFGVTSQVLIKRTKEVSIRKILGASTGNLLILLSKDYLVWLGSCFVLGVPLAYFLFSSWLEEFPVRISLGWWFFTLPIITILVVFAGTALTLTFRTLFANPAEILKSE